MSYKHVKEWRLRTKTRLLEAFGSKCGICSYDRCQRALEFHHLDPSKKDFSLSKWRKVCAWSKLVDEVRKCVLLCTNCHREVHDGMSDDSCAPRFNEEYTEYREDILVVFDICPMCGVQKPNTKKYCSLKCAGLSRNRVDWSSINLQELLNKYKTYTAVGKLLGVTDNAVRKQCVKRNIRK